jgi:uncharacterized RDD family membrane protein YckC
MACLNHPGVALPLVRCAGCLQNLCRACVEPDEQFFYCARCHPSRGAKAPPVPPAPSRSPPPSRAPETASAAPRGAPLAGLPRRFLALVIDVLVVGLALRLLLSRISDDMSIVALMFVVPTIYEAAFLQHMGQTIGKALLGVQVVSDDGSPVSGVQAVGRSALKVMQFTCCGLTYLSVLFSKERRGLHDFGAGTRVVRAGEPASTGAGD